MGMSRKAIVVLVPSLLFGLGAPAWSGTADQAPSAELQAAPANPNGNTLLGMLSAVLTDTDPGPRQPKDQCKAPHLYSQHDVVGDPEACFMGHYSIGSGSTSAAGVP
jgi:hypothetical protein